MKFCQPHWDAMRDAVKSRRMWRFVPTSGEAEHERIKRQLEMEPSDQGESEFNPLTDGMFKITTAVTKNIERSEGPLSALQHMGDPNWCPLCDVQKSFDRLQSEGAAGQAEFIKRAPKGSEPLDAQGWIDRTMDGALKYAKEQGWELDSVQ